MFKNLTAYRIQGDWHPSHASAEAALKKFPFVECGATQAISAGWIPPRGEKHGPLVEAVGEQWLLSLCVQTKIIPAGVVKKGLEMRIEQIRHREGRKPGKKEVRELKEAVILELLPKAFAKEEIISVWVDRRNKLVVIDTTSASKSDSTTSSLIKTLDGLALGLVQTEMSPATCMSQWLMDDEPPHNFSVDSECELKSDDERRSSVKYSRHQLDTDEVKQHLSHGKSPTQLAMTWTGRVSFVLTANMALKKIAFLEAPLLKKRGEDDPFDANGAIVTGELAQLIPDLIEALGGESEFDVSRPKGKARPRPPANSTRASWRRREERRPRGRMITLSESDGVGKTTQVDAVVNRLRNQRFDPVVTSEPGGTPVAEQLRSMVLNGHGIDPVTEMMLVVTARHAASMVTAEVPRGLDEFACRVTDPGR